MLVFDFASACLSCSCDYSVLVYTRLSVVVVVIVVVNAVVAVDGGGAAATVTVYYLQNNCGPLKSHSWDVSMFLSIEAPA